MATVANAWEQFNTFTSVKAPKVTGTDATGRTYTHKLTTAPADTTMDAVEQALAALPVAIVEASAVLAETDAGKVKYSGDKRAGKGVDVANLFAGLAGRGPVVVRPKEATA